VEGVRILQPPEAIVKSQTLEGEGLEEKLPAAGDKEVIFRPKITILKK